MARHGLFLIKKISVKTAEDNSEKSLYAEMVKFMRCSLQWLTYNNFQYFTISSFCELLFEAMLLFAGLADLGYCRCDFHHFCIKVQLLRR